MQSGQPWFVFARSDAAVTNKLPRLQDVKGFLILILKSDAPFFQYANARTFPGSRTEPALTVGQTADSQSDP